jgi:NADPH-dependent 2,4-dienoyl-CoA reductase/sulfur reductase-like enzyme
MSVRVVCVGGSDAGIAAALGAATRPGLRRDRGARRRVPNFSICWLPYAISGEVARWQDLAHRSAADLEATGMRLRTDTRARSVDVAGQQLTVTTADGRGESLPYA